MEIENGINGIEIDNDLEARACPITKVFWNIVDTRCDKVTELSFKSKVAESAIRNYLARKAIPRLDIASKVLNALGYELTIKKKRS